MNRTVYQLLKGYLIRSVWLYAFLGVAQFALTGVYWLHAFGRMPVVGLVLSMWGAAAALNANSLVWRSLPIVAKDARAFRWWAMAGAPAIYLTLLTGITWASQRSGGFPALDVLWEGIFAIWAVAGIVAMLFRSPAIYAARAPGAKTIATVSFATVLLCYGVPVGSAVRPYSFGFITVGMVLLVISAAQAYRGRHWRWPDIASRSFAPSTMPSAAPIAYRYGIWTVLLPLFQRTAIVAAIATALVVMLHFIFPSVGALLFWVYFIGISTVGFLLTFQFRSALPPLRCLPLSTQQLAGLLLFLGALPGVATLGLTFLVNRALLNVDMDFSAIAAIALIMIAAQAMPLRQENARAAHLGRWVRWFILAQRILLPAYIGLMAAIFNRTALWWWFRGWLVMAGIVLCFSGYFILVNQLRAGISPSSNERLFSAG